MVSIIWKEILICFGPWENRFCVDGSSKKCFHYESKINEYVEVHLKECKRYMIFLHLSNLGVLFSCFYGLLCYFLCIQNSKNIFL